jgi:hypothetical protein
MSGRGQGSNVPTSGEINRMYNLKPTMDGYEEANSIRHAFQAADRQNAADASNSSQAHASKK